MSVTHMAAAWKLDISSTDKLVLLALADWSNEDGACWPSMSQLASKSGLTDRAIRASIGRLVLAGHLTRDENPGKGVYYTVHPGTAFRQEDTSPRNKLPKTPERRSANTSGTIKPKKPQARETLIPEGFEPSVKPGSITAKAMDGWPPGRAEEEIEHFVDHHTAKNTMSADWQASWRTWVKNSKKWEPRNARSANNRNGTPATGHGKSIDAGFAFIADGEPPRFGSGFSH